MQALTEKLLFHPYRERILDETQLAHLMGGTSARRYGLTNRALQAGELQRLMRGLYVLPQRFRQTRLHPFVIAQRLYPTSYVSFETALAWHGWIPEAVHTVASVTPGRKTLQYQPDGFGLFTYHPMALHKGYFLVQVARIELEGQAALLANPLRALLDWACFHKQPWQGLAFLQDSLRIESESLARITAADITNLRYVYKHQAVQHWLMQLCVALQLNGEAV